jgi:hypothetical protein
MDMGDMVKEDTEVMVMGMNTEVTAISKTVDTGTTITTVRKL